MYEKKFKYLIYTIILIIVFGACSAIDNEYFEEIDNFRTKRIDFLVNESMRGGKWEDIKIILIDTR